MNETSVYWNRPYGWRAGSPYIDQEATASGVIRFEGDEYENDLDVPDFLLDELDRQRYTARDVRWVCRTRQDARRYSGPGIGQPYREEFGPNAIILATDHEEETGYLVLFDASRLDPAILELYIQYRQAQLSSAQHQTSPEAAEQNKQVAAVPEKEAENFTSRIQGKVGKSTSPSAPSR